MSPSLVGPRPIFIFGPGRSGTTLLHELLSLHSDLAYFSSWTNRFPHRPALARLSSLRPVPWEARGRPVRRLPAPTEAYRIWLHCFPDFWKINCHACDDEAGAERLRRVVAAHQRAQRRPRFVAKLTGYPLFPFVKSIFPDAAFVWVDRDPRAVVFSQWRLGWIRAPLDRIRTGDGPGEPCDPFRWIRLAPGVLPPQDELAFLADRYLSIRQRLHESHDPYHLVRYEGLIADPAGTLRRLVEQVGLGPDTRQSRWVRRWKIHHGANDAWRTGLPRVLADLLTSRLDGVMGLHGYR